MNDLHPDLNLLKMSALCLNPGLRQEINQFRYNSTYSDKSGQISRQTEAWLPKRSRWVAYIGIYYSFNPVWIRENAK